jgi:tetratricopeptide (TPR) repeat protein
MSAVTPATHYLTGQHVVFIGKLSSLGRREAQALVARLGGVTSDRITPLTTMVVMAGERIKAITRAGAASEKPDGDRIGELGGVEELSLKGTGSIRIVNEDQFCELAGLPSSAALKQQYYPLRDVLAKYANVREDHVRYLQKFGLIQPVVRTANDKYVNFSDLVTIRQASAELEQGAPFRAVLRSLTASRSGQLAFNFRIDAEPARIIQLSRSKISERARPLQLSQADSVTRQLSVAKAAEDYFLEGSRLDDLGVDSQELAAAAYRQALEIDPYLVAAVINLANIHYARDELAEAQALYERAIDLEPAFFEAHFNLGNVYHDLGRYAEAARCYKDALELNPQYADAHFYLAVTLENMGHSQDARPHWHTYQQLAPAGEWADLAREFTE